MWKYNVLICCLFIIRVTAFSQSEQGEIHGNIQIDAQTYKPDSLINAQKVPEKFLLNSYANITYSKGKFKAGLRYEAYLNRLEGFDTRYNGTGFPYKYISYIDEHIEITAGSFYEQFGMGLVLRAYEEKAIGYDNAFEGVRIKLKPLNGILITGLTAKQRNFFEIGPGIVRAANLDIGLNDIIKNLQDKPTLINWGASFVSKYQPDKDPIYKLPENVGAFASHLNITRKGWNFYTEYVYKINDPSTDNKYIYKEGQALLLNIGYNTKGFGWILNAKRIDNLSFRSDRNATLMQLNINYIPTFTRTFTYSLLNFYPYATQPNGEIGAGTEILYKFKKGTFLGGEHGTNISINYNRLYDIKKSIPPDTSKIGIPGTLGYKSPFFGVSNNLYYESLTTEINKKISSSFTINILYQYFVYNFDVLRGITGKGNVYGHVGVVDGIYKLNDKNAIHFDSEILLTKQDEGNWSMLTLEYSIAPNWFFAISDNINFNNPKSNEIQHYYLGSIAFAKGGSRVQLGYGRQPQGVFCIGGVCRNVPASNGFIISVSSTF